MIRRFIQLLSLEEPRFRWCIQNSQEPQVSDFGSGDLAALNHWIEQKPSQPSFLILPGEYTLWLKTTLPGRSRKALATLPFLLEEQLSTPLEQVEIFHGETDRSNQIESLSIDKERYQKIIQLTQQINTPFESWVIDFQLIRGSDEETLCISDGNRVCFSSSEGCGSVTQAVFDQLPLTKPIHWLNTKDRTPECALSTLASLYSADHCIELMPAELQSKTKHSQGRSGWKTPLTWLVIAIIASASNLVMQNMALEREAAQQQQSIESAFKQLLPDARRMVNPLAQLKAAHQQHQGGQGRQDLLSSLSLISKLISEQQVKASSIRYNNSPFQLAIEIEAANFAQIDKLLNALQSHQLEATPGTINQSNQGVTGVLNFSQGALR